MAGLIEKDKFETAYNLHQKILITAQMAQKNLYDMCVMLKQMRDDKLYKELGYNNFEDYCEEEVGMKRRNAYRYISVVENIKNVSSMTQIGMTKLSLLADLSESQQEEIQEKVKVEDVSVRELKEEIKRLKQANDDAEKRLDDTEHQLREENTKRIHLQSDVLSLKSKNRSLSHELEEAKKMSGDAKGLAARLKDAERELSVADQDHYNKLEAQRIEYQKKINALQKQLDNTSSMRDVAVETVEVPATKEIFEAYCCTMRSAFKQLADFVGGLDKTIKQDYVKQVTVLLGKLDDDLYDVI